MSEKAKVFDPAPAFAQKGLTAMEKIDVGPGIRGGQRGIHGRCANPQNANAASPEHFEVDPVGGVRPASPRKLFRKGRRRVPYPRALQPVGQHHLPGRQRRRAIGRFETEKKPTRPVRLDPEKLGPVPNLDRHDASAPSQVLHPHRPGNTLQTVPVRPLEPGRIPRREGHVSDARVWPGQVLGRSQRHHPREGDPGAFLPLLGPVDHEDVPHTLTPQRQGDGQTALTRAYHNDIVIGGRLGLPDCGKPFPVRVIEPHEVQPYLRGKRVKARPCIGVFDECLHPDDHRASSRSPPAAEFPASRPGRRR